jgi:hypothetical protein
MALVAQKQERAVRHDVLVPWVATPVVASPVAVKRRHLLQQVREAVLARLRRCRLAGDTARPPCRLVAALRDTLTVDHLRSYEVSQLSSLLGYFGRDHGVDSIRRCERGACQPDGDVNVRQATFLELDNPLDVLTAHAEETAISQSFQKVKVSATKCSDLSGSKSQQAT